MLSALSSARRRHTYLGHLVTSLLIRENTNIGTTGNRTLVYFLRIEKSRFAACDDMLSAWLPMGEMCVEVMLEMYGLWAYKPLFGQCVHGEGCLLCTQAAWSAHCRGEFANMLLGQGQASARRLEVDARRSIETDGLSDGPYC